MFTSYRPHCSLPDPFGFFPGIPPSSPANHCFVFPGFLPLSCPLNVSAPLLLICLYSLGSVLHCMASVMSLLGSWDMQGMLPEEVTFELVLQKEICQAVRNRQGRREQHMQMPSILWLVWSGELRGAGEAQVLRALCAIGRTHWALS